MRDALDGSLYLVSKMFGKARAQMVALNMEYDWKPDSTYARASLADRHIRRIFGTGLRLPVPEGTEARVMSTAGDTRLWEVNWQVQGETSAADLHKPFSTRLVDAQWKKQDAESKDCRSVWKFSDENGAVWTGVALIQPSSNKTFAVSLKIHRSDIDAAKPVGSSFERFNAKGAEFFAKAAKKISLASFAVVLRGLCVE